MLQRRRTPEREGEGDKAVDLLFMQIPLILLRACLHIAKAEVYSGTAASTEKESERQKDIQ